MVNKIDFKPHSLKVYNLDVTDNHTYLVTTLNIVTHNSNLVTHLNHDQMVLGCEVAAATGVLAGIADWLGGMGIGLETGGLAAGFSATLGAPVLIAAGAAGVGIMTWQELNFWGHKHVDQSIHFDPSQIR